MHIVIYLLTITSSHDMIVSEDVDMDNMANEKPEEPLLVFLLIIWLLLKISSTSIAI